MLREERATRRAALLRYALAYAGLGWPVFPIIKGGKRPLTEHGLKDASTDPAQITAWLDQWPDCNIAIPTGACAWVLDVDARHGGIEAWEAISAQHPAIDTLTARTGGGGVHYWFKPHLYARNTTARIGSGLDTRGAGGYVLVEPSRTENGYTFNDWDILNGELPALADAPDWLISAAFKAPAEPPATPAPAKGIKEGGRNHALASLAGAMRRKGMSVEAITAALVAENDVSCFPPLPGDEVRAIAQSIGRYEPADPHGELRAAAKQILGPRPDPFKELAETRKARASERRKEHPNFTTWQEWGLDLPSGGGPPIANLHNAVTIIENDPLWSGAIHFDAFLQRIITGTPPREWSDHDDIELAVYMQSELGISRIGKEIISQSVLAAAHRNSKNCVTDWLDSLRWDATERIEHFFPDHFGADDNEYSRAASRNFWLCIVKRAYEPGCKVDNMIVLEGSQGAGKSTAMQIVGGPWFAEQHESAANPKGFAEILQGKLLVEISEMDAFNRTEVNRVKQTVSCPSDRFRPAYGRYALDNPRTCVFVGTTNKDDWNRDETGARRFWPIKCLGAINLPAIRENREQLFAEAVHLIKAGAQHWLMPSEATKAEQDARFQTDPWHDKVESYIRNLPHVSTQQILESIGVPLDRQTKHEQMRIAACLRFLNWHRKRRRLEVGTAPVWVYLPADTV